MVVERDPARNSVIEILDRVLDKGIVVDASIRISLAGIEVVAIDARVVVASVETYLRHADTIAFTALASPAPRQLSGADDRSVPAIPEGERRGERRNGDRRGGKDRRWGVGRRVANRRMTDIPVAVERRSVADRRGPARRRASGLDRADRRSMVSRRSS
jgi:hypothetical protein